MSVYQIKRKDLWIAAWYENGKKKTRGFKHEQEARAFDSERLQSTRPIEGLLTLGELVALFFRSHPDYNQHTKNNVVSMFTEDNPAAFMRNKYAIMLSRQDLERLREGYRARGDCNNTLNKKQAYIRAILAWGADQELIDRNPWRDFKRLPVARNICATTIQDIRAVLQVAPDWLKWSIATCFALSLRPGQIELFSLLWSAFDWRRGLVMVRQGKSGRLKTVFPPAQYMQIANDRYKCDIERGIQLVCHRNGKRIYAYNKAWEKVIKNARVQHFPMYHIRHVAASEMLAGGADLASVAAQLGHSNVNTTGAFYAHVTAGGQQRAAAILPNLQA